MRDKAVVLLSGGLDSAVALAGAVDFYEVTCLGVDYGQRHAEELICAERVALHCGVPFVRQRVPLDWLVSALSRTEERELGCRTLDEIRKDWYSPMIVPGRNAILLSLGIALAESIGAAEVIFSANADDKAFPDCRAKFVDAMNAVSLHGTVNHPKVVAPLLHRPKAWVAQEANRLRVPIAETCSCYQPQGRLPSGEVMHCGRCDACVIRRDAFERAQAPDPTYYVVDL